MIAPAAARALLLVVTALAQAPSPADLGRAGWELLNAGKVKEAADAFDRALQRAPEEPTLLVGSALAAHLQGRTDDARRRLVDALRVAPSLTPASLLLGEVLYRAGDLDGAITIYEQALAHAPEHAQLLKQLEAWRKEAALHGRFAQKLGDHFTVLFEGPAEERLATRAVEILETAYWRIGTALYAYPADVITVVLYTREQFRDITQSPEWAGGAFDGRIRVPVQGALDNAAEFERVLTHEFTHALVRSVAPRGVPVWLDEGLAQTFEPPPPPDRVSRPFGTLPPPFPLSRLERSFAGLDAAEAQRAYKQSAEAVSRLLSWIGAPAVASILADIGRGIPFPQAFERHAFMTYEEFQQKLRGL
jgi:tetratricopeptide (TPR) repeat protein